MAFVAAVTGKISARIAEWVIGAAKSQLKGIYAGMPASTFVRGMFIDAWLYSFGLASHPLASPQPQAAAKPFR